MGRPEGNVELANSMIGIQSGISTVHSIGTNYTDMWQSGVNITGSYFFNRSDNDNDQVNHRDYTMTGDTRTAYDERTTGTTGNGNHRFCMRMDVPIDSMNSFLFVPNISYQSTEGTSLMDGASRLQADRSVLHQRTAGPTARDTRCRRTFCIATSSTCRGAPSRWTPRFPGMRATGMPRSGLLSSPTPSSPN